MAFLTNLTRRLWRWARAGLHLESAPGPPESAPSSANEERRRLELAVCNQALANAVNARDQLRATAAALARERERCQTELRRAVDAGLEESGAQHALRQQELLAEERELQEQLREAEAQVNGLTRLREELVER